MFAESIYFWEIQNVQSFKLHFFQNSPLVQLYTSASNYIKEMETFLEAILGETFQPFRRILNVSCITKAPTLQG
jgi:3-deoxy-D-arabino-heptulosonate 7-phosphate (DAHP) synthase class II